MQRNAQIPLVYPWYIFVYYIQLIYVCYGHVL